MCVAISVQNYYENADSSPMCCLFQQPTNFHRSDLEMNCRSALNSLKFHSVFTREFVGQQKPGAHKRLFLLTLCPTQR